MVSVLVPIYNVSLYIERCAHSLFGQTFKEIEFVFVDDCTPDDSIEKLSNILTLYPERSSSVKIINKRNNFHEKLSYCMKYIEYYKNKSNI